MFAKFVCELNTTSAGRLNILYFKGEQSLLEPSVLLLQYLTQYPQRCVELWRIICVLQIS